MKQTELLNRHQHQTVAYLILNSAKAALRQADGETTDYYKSVIRQVIGEIDQLQTLMERTGLVDPDINHE